MMRDALGREVHFTLKRTTDATMEPLTAAQAALWHRIDPSTATAEDDVIDALIRAVRQQVEADTGRAVLTQTWEMSVDGTPERGVIVLPIAPVQSITSIKSYTVADVESTVATSVYRLDTSSTPARIVLKDGQTWPSDRRPQNGLVITFVAGYGDTAASAAIDEPLIQAMRLLFGHWYEHREAVRVGNISTELPLGYQAIIAPLRVWA